MGSQQSISLCPSGGLYQIFYTGAKRARNSFYRSSSELSFGQEVPYFETMIFVTNNLFKALKDKRPEQKSKNIEDSLFYQGQEMTIENCLEACPPPDFKIFILALIFCKRIIEAETLETNKINFSRLINDYN